jgi:hypothetical protein
MSLKNKLLKLYSDNITKFEYIADFCKNDEISGPFLMAPSEKFSKQEKTLLIIGQETKGWARFDDKINLMECEKVMSVYEDFNLGEHYFSSPFWNVMRKIETMLGNEPYSSAWTNISKYDQNNARPDSKHEQIFSEIDDLLKDEVQILSPKICLFFTSYKFDTRIEKIFKNIEFIEIGGFDKKQICQLKHPNLPELTFRTYHPQYLRRSGLEKLFIELVETRAK